MTKREREMILRRIDRLTERVGKKRDELRKLLQEVVPLIESVEQGCDDLGEVLSLLKSARDSFEDATDRISQHA